MKAVIVDIQGKYAAALAENGEVKKIPDDHYEIGQEVALTEIIPIKQTPRPAAKVIRRVLIAAAVLVTLTAVGFGTAYAVPVGTVSVDAEPSIEYTINCFDYVIGVKALNEDGETVLNEINVGELKHHKIDVAVSATVNQIEKDGYLKADGSEIKINAETGSDDRDERLQNDLNTTVNQPQREETPDVKEEAPAPQSSTADDRQDRPQEDEPRYNSSQNQGGMYSKESQQDDNHGQQQEPANGGMIQQNRISPG